MTAEGLSRGIAGGIADDCTKRHGGGSLLFRHSTIASFLIRYSIGKLAEIRFDVSFYLVSHLVSAQFRSAAAAILDWIIHRPVEDTAGLQGRFDFPFDHNRVGPAAADMPPVRVADAVTAFQTVVVEHFEKAPAGN
jgi:hypothetical protein